MHGGMRAMRGGPHGMRGRPPFFHPLGGRGRGPRGMRGGIPQRGMYQGVRGTISVRDGEMWIGGGSWCSETTPASTHNFQCLK